ncbi:MAG: FdhF/YdeP family oxidoreductase [Chthoniobacterales bacterium]|nr:FdhF/YdeP family oxidoreductase [Chthoniobacterales bacterium]
MSENSGNGAPSGGADAPRRTTTDQRPDAITLGVPKTPDAEHAERDQENPTPGAQPPFERERTDITEPHHSAAGFPAIYQTTRFAVGEMGLVRGVKTLLKVNQKDGFDCQSCAWPSPDHHRQVAEFCENGAKAIADEGTTKRVTTEFSRQHSVEFLRGQSDYWLGQQGRLTHPMVKRPGATHYETIAWDDAFQLIAKELNALSSPDAASFYTSGRTSNEAAFLWQLFARQFGTNNLPDCSNMCHESSGEALNETIGIGKGCVKLEDFDHADAIFIIGQNPGTNHPRMLTSLQRAKESRDRHAPAKIVSINPMPEVGNFRFKNPQDLKNPLRAPGFLLGKGTELSDLWLPVRINGDIAVLKGIMKEMLAAEDARPGTIFDQAFIRDHTVGFEDLIADLRATSWDDILIGSGLTREQIRLAANVVMNAKRMICCWAMGLTQQKDAIGTIQMVMNLLFLGGHIGRPGAGPCPVRGHSNVQGDRTMGIWERMNDDFMKKLGAEFNFAPPPEHGLDVVESIKEMHRGHVQAFIAMGGNFLSATPDTEYTAKALQKCRLTAHVAIKLNRSHLVTGETALILPCLGRSEVDRQAGGEQFVTVEDSMGIINPSRGALEPASKHLRSEPAIIAGIAAATLNGRSAVDWNALVSDYSRIRDHIEHVIPGFERFNERIAKDIFYLPNDARDHRKFNNKIGKAKFTVHSIPRNEIEPGRYVMMTIRSHDQFNTHIYGLDDRYRGIYNGRRVIFMNNEDVKAAGLQQGQLVDLTSHFEGEERAARHFQVAPYDLPRGCTATYFPEANVLVPINSVAERSNQPTSKFVVISVAPSPDAADAAAAQFVRRSVQSN